MSLFHDSALVGASGSSGAAGYEIERSLRFNSSDSAFLSRTPASAGNRKTWTWAGWVKRSGGNEPGIFSSYAGSNPSTTLYFNVDNRLVFYDYNSVYRINLLTTQVFRDFSAWYHILVAVNTTAATSTDRVKIYVNGAQITAFNRATYPALDWETNWNSVKEHNIGKHVNYQEGYLADVHFIDGQALTPSSFTEVSATTGQLIPKAYTGSFGTNGFWLKFSDNSAATATTLGKDYSGNSNNWTPNNLAVGGAQPALYSSPNLYTSAADVITNGTPLSSGSTFSNVYVYLVTNGGGDVGSKVFTADGSGSIGTNWTWLHRIGASWDYSGSYNNTEWDLWTWGSQTVATTYVMNNSAPLHMLVSSAGSPQQVSGTIATFNSTPNSGTGNDSLVDTPTSAGTDTGLGGQVTGNYATWNPLASSSNPTIRNGNLDVLFSVAGTVLGSIGLNAGKWYWEVTVLDTNPMIGIAKQGCNLASYPGSDSLGWGYSTADGYKYNGGSGSSYGATATTNDVIGLAFDADNGTLTYYKNGSSQGTAFTGLTAGPYFPAVGRANAAPFVAANFGQRPFAYTAPSGFKALCDTNLSAPVVAKPSEVMDVALWTGNGAASRTISGLGFSPDLVWIKSRSTAGWHALVDQVRGAGKILASNDTASEYNNTGSNNAFQAFTSDGFTIGQQTSWVVNDNSVTQVAWTWDAGSSTVTNTQGSITSQVRANASAGFSIVTYTGNGTNPGATIGHGLGVSPALIITKARSASSTWWPSYHSALPISNTLYLNSTVSSTTYVNRFSAVSSTTFTTGSSGSELNDNGVTYVAYCFAPVAGYSSAFSFTGNGSSDGPMVWLGFKPRFLFIKRTDSASHWPLYDTARNPYNVTNSNVWASTSDGEITDAAYSIDILSNGFKLRTSDAARNASGGTYIGFAWAENPFQYARAR